MANLNYAGATMLTQLSNDVFDKDKQLYLRNSDPTTYM